MERYILFFFLSLSLGTAKCYSQDNIGTNDILHLEKGDVFIYNIQEQYSFLTKYPDGAIYSSRPGRESRSTPKTINRERSRYFEVLEKTGNGCYILIYRLKYIIERTEVAGISTSWDSRFPDYGTHPRKVVDCFLNTASFQVKFCPTNGKFEILNMTQVREDLVKYLDARGIPDNLIREDAISISLNEARILADIQYLYSFLILPDKSTYSKKREDAEIATVQRTGSTDKTTTYNVVVDNFVLQLNESFPDRKYSKRGTCTFDNNSGLLINSETNSYLGEGRIKTDSIWSERSDIADYSESIELQYYSGNCKPTWICGKYKIKDVDKVGITTKNRIIGSETVYQEYQKDSTGYFEIPLEITESRNYTLHFFKTFPSYTGYGDCRLFIKPGDSIFVSFDSINREYGYSGRGYKDSEVYNKIYLPDNLEKIFHIFNPEISRPFSVNNVDLKIRNTIEHHFQLLMEEKNNISKEFYEYSLSEFNNAQGIMDYHDYWKSCSAEYLQEKNISFENNLLLLPDLPSYPQYDILQQYDSYIYTYTMLRYYLFNYISTGGFPLTYSLPDIDFKKTLLTGLPYYITVGNMMVELIAHYRESPFPKYADYMVDEFLENCNHQESRDYINDLIRRKWLISPGNKYPELDLLNLDGNKFDWENASGKVIVMMLYKDYTREPYYAEELFKEYGENRKEVIILRISPGINFKKWKTINERYSNLGHQMFYTGGEQAFNRQFLTNYGISSRYLVIDRQGKIFRTPGTVQQLKGAINGALKKPPPPKTPFLKTRIGRALPGILIGILITAILYRLIVWRRIKKRELLHRLSSLEHKAIKAQLNPHFLFNCLNSIQNLINKNRQKEANEYLTSFASLIRKVLQYSDKDEVSIHDDLETLKIYLELEKLRFEFNTIIEIDPLVDIYNTMIPPMLLQPAIENAIIHGLDPKKGNRVLKIEVTMQSGSILFRIEDNGVGRNTLIKAEPESKSRGLDIIRSRIELMNVGQPKSFSFEIIDKTDAAGKSTGTIVEIVIPDEK